MAEIEAHPSLTGSLVLERALKLGLDCGDDPAFIRFDEKRRGDHRALTAVLK